MTDRLTSDTSFWLKFVQDANISTDTTTKLQFSMALADHFTTTKQLLEADENQWNRIGIQSQADRSRLINHARHIEDKLTEKNQSLALKRRSAVASRVVESWLGDNQLTPSSRNTLSKSNCNLSPALLSRISFNDRPVSVAYPYDEPGDEARRRNFGISVETREKVLTVDDNGKIQTTRNSPPLEYHGVLKRTSSTSISGLRTMKSLSDTISLQKKLSTGTDRLKRLDSSISLFQRQTSFITRKVTHLAQRIVNPFGTLKKTIDTSASDDTMSVDLRTTMKRKSSIIEKDDHINHPVRRTVTITPLKRTREDEEPVQQKRTVQILSINNNIERVSTELSLCETEMKRTVLPVQTLGSKRFKMGATTSFLTRSLANHGLME